MFKQSMKKSHGFSLLELAVVLVLLGVLLGGLIASVSTQQKNQRIRTTKAELNDIRSALIGFAIQHGRLPCPDTDGDGRENNSAPQYRCDAATGITASPSVPNQRRLVSGNLPFKDLASPSLDPFGNPYTYAVTLHYADIPRTTGPFAYPDPTPFPELSATSSLPPSAACAPALGSMPPLLPTFSSCSKGGLRLLAQAGDDSTLIYDDLPFIVLSKGENGALPNGALNINERENADGDRTFIQRPLSTQSSGNFYYDDLMVWESSPTLALALIKAGVLP